MDESDEVHEEDESDEADYEMDDTIEEGSEYAYEYAYEYATLFPLWNRIFGMPAFGIQRATPFGHRRWLKDGNSYAGTDIKHVISWKDVFYRSRLEILLSASSMNDGTDLLNFVFGNADNAAIFSTRRFFSDYPRVETQDVLWCLQNGIICPRCLNIHILKTNDKIGRVLYALSTAARIYRGLPEATIAIRALDQNLLSASWVQILEEDHSLGLSTQPRFCFAVIAYFDQGSCNVGTQSFEDVIAISSADSLYVLRTVFFITSSFPYLK
jgi:hypothetical protein